MGLNLYYFDARYFDPQTGRFLGMDPKMQLASGYQGMGGNPAMFVDPDGQFFGLDDLIVSAVGFVAGYVSSGIKTGNWGWKSVQSGLIGAASFELGYVSGGTAFNAEFAAGAFGNSAAYSVMGNYIAASAVSFAAGQFLPNIPIIQSPNFSLSVGPSFAVGSGGWSAGINASATASVGDLDIGVGGGIGYGHSNITSITEKSSYLSLSAGRHIGDAHLGLTSSYFGGSTSQRVGGVYAGIGQANLRYENDWISDLPIGDNGDKFRTAALRLSYKDYSLGFSLFTGDPNVGAIRPADHDGKPQTYAAETANDYRAGIAYFGYGNYQVGINSERVRNLIQNHLVHKDGYKYPIFTMINRWIRPYVSYRSNNPFTTW